MNDGIDFLVNLSLLLTVGVCLRYYLTYPPVETYGAELIYIITNSLTFGQNNFSHADLS